MNSTRRKYFFSPTQGQTLPAVAPAPDLEPVVDQPHREQLVSVVIGRATIGGPRQTISRPARGNGGRWRR